MPSSVLPITISPGPAAIYDVAKLHEANCTIFKGKVYNKKGHKICGVLNQHDKPCHRIGPCPFHFYSIVDVNKGNVCNGTVDDSGSSVDPPPPPPSSSSDDVPTKKKYYKHGWSKKEHYLFLVALRTHGNGAWKQIANAVQTRNPTQVQTHAQKFFLRQQQEQAISLDSLEMKEIGNNCFNLSAATKIRNANTANAIAVSLQNMAPITPVTSSIKNEPVKNEPVLAQHNHNNGNGNSISGFLDLGMPNIPDGNVGANDNAISPAKPCPMPFGSANDNGDGNESAKGSHY